MAFATRYENKILMDNLKDKFFCALGFSLTFLIVLILHSNLLAKNLSPLEYRDVHPSNGAILRVLHRPPPCNSQLTWILQDPPPLHGGFSAFPTTCLFSVPRDRQDYAVGQ